MSSRSLRLVRCRAGVVVPKTGAVLNESAIRGVASRGMLMSEAELALSDSHDGITRC